jgi:hypothetical protein
MCIAATNLRTGFQQKKNAGKLFAFIGLDVDRPPAISYLQAVPHGDGSAYSIVVKTQTPGLCPSLKIVFIKIRIKNLAVKQLIRAD